MKKKGCFYWLLIGWWFEPIYHILSKWCGAGIIFKTILYCSLFLILGTLLVGAYAFIALFLIIASVIGFVIKYFSSKCLSNVNFDSMTGIEFENFCAIILRNNGFRNVQITKASGDHGIDILANKMVRNTPFNANAIQTLLETLLYKRHTLDVKYTMPISPLL